MKSGCGRINKEVKEDCGIEVGASKHEEHGKKNGVLQGMGVQQGLVDKKREIKKGGHGSWTKLGTRGGGA